MTSFLPYYYRQPEKTKVVYIIQTDLKGRLPMKLIDSVLPSNQLSFFSSVRKAIKDGILDKWTPVSISVFHPYTYISHKSCDCHMTTHLFLSDVFCTISWIKFISQSSVFIVLYMYMYSSYFYQSFLPLGSYESWQKVKFLFDGLLSWFCTSEIECGPLSTLSTINSANSSSQDHTLQ